MLHYKSTVSSSSSQAVASSSSGCGVSVCPLAGREARVMRPGVGGVLLEPGRLGTVVAAVPLDSVSSAVGEGIPTTSLGHSEQERRSSSSTSTSASG